MFKKIGLAITFSPRIKALLKETKRIAEKFNSEILLIHVGEKTSEKENLLNDILNQTNLQSIRHSIAWTKGDVAKAIIKKIKEENCDLLVAGALEKETLLKYYLGSVARKLLRQTPCSILVFTSPQENPEGFKDIAVSVDYSQHGIKSITTAVEFAKFEKVKKITLIKDFYVPGLPITITDFGSVADNEKTLKKLIEDEQSRLNEYLSGFNFNDIQIEKKCVYGKPGFETINYVRENKFSLFVLNAPTRKIIFLDRLLTNTFEYILENIPTNLLIIK